MAQAAENPNLSPETREPSPKIQKTDETGVAGTKHTGISPFSAGEEAFREVQWRLRFLLEVKALVPADIGIAVPEGTYARIAPRSGLAWKHSIDVGAGVVDADYRGPVGLILFNHCDVDFEVKPGDRIAQLILEKIAN